MSKKKKGGMPRLRFPEFQDIGGWETKPLKNFLSESKIRGNKGDNAKKLTVKLWGKGVYAKDSKIKGSKNTQYYKRKAGQIIYSKLDFLNGAFGLIPSKLDGYESTADLPCFDVKKDNNSIFLLKYILRKEFYSKVGEIADGSRKAKRIHQKTFLLFPVSFPQEEEQKKIANCLSSLDEIINLETEKLETLKSHKKGLMQQLFPRDGETTPRLRFPEFRDMGEWEGRQLGRIFIERNERDSSELNLLSVTLSDGVVKTSELDRKNNASANLSNYKKVLPNDIVYNSMRMWQGASGVSKWVGIVSPAYTVITPVEYQHSVFWSYYFRHKENIEKFARFSQGVTSDTWNLKYPTFSRIKLSFPEQTEQQKIANCFSSLDRTIDLQTQKLETLKTHKKGLMQQLFPQEV